MTCCHHRTKTHQEMTCCRCKPPCHAIACHGTGLHSTIVCQAMPCQAVARHNTPLYVKPCQPTARYAMSSCGTAQHAKPRQAPTWYTMPCQPTARQNTTHSMARHAQHATLRHAKLLHGMPTHVNQRYSTAQHTTLRRAISMSASVDPKRVD
jgi:hypothetical protein